jgi:hypothetical protein
MTDSQLAPLTGESGTDDRPLHWVIKHEHPVALCGFIVSDEWDQNRPTAGCDRCPECMRLARERGLL